MGDRKQRASMLRASLAHTKLPVVRCARLSAAFAVDAEKRLALYRARELPP